MSVGENSFSLKFVMIVVGVCVFVVVVVVRLIRWLFVVVFKIIWFIRFSFIILCVLIRNCCFFGSDDLIGKGCRFMFLVSSCCFILIVVVSFGLEVGKGVMRIGCVFSVVVCCVMIVVLLL